MADEFPTRRTLRPNRQSRGAYIDQGLLGPDEPQIIAALTAAGFPPECHADALYAVNEAASYWIEHRIPPLRTADEREDLKELLVRAEDLLDSLRALANQTRCRILDASPAMVLTGDPYKLQEPLQALVWHATAALEKLPADVGGVKHDDSDSQFLADLAVIFFRQFPNSDGVKRNGSAKDHQSGEEYSGGLLDFVVNILAATKTALGSKRAIGEKLHRTPPPYPDRDGLRRLSIQDWARSPEKARLIAARIRDLARKSAMERSARETPPSIEKSAVPGEEPPDGG